MGGQDAEMQIGGQELRRREELQTYDRQRG
jgi:hypothetical protein